MNTPDTKKPKSKAAKVLSFIGAVFSMALIASISKACQSDRIREQQIERASIVTSVWIRNPVLDRIMPYYDVEVLKQSAGYIKFRMQDGRIIEQSGEYQIQTANRQ